jgi:hypothetical protein
MKVKFYFDKNSISKAMMERKITANFEWNMYIPWLLGMYKLARYPYSISGEQHFEPSDSNVFKLLLMPFKLIGSTIAFTVYKTLFWLIMPFLALAAIKIKRSDNNACKRSSI